jgi:predicted acyl esterase
VCENYDEISIPSMVISGWADGYLNAPPAMAENSLSVSRAINGPWIHNYPHIAWPKPRMDFHGEAIAWWDRWLKGIENGVEEMPAYRAYISEGIRPGGYRDHEPGRWVAETQWPSPDIKDTGFYLANSGKPFSNQDIQSSAAPPYPSNVPFTSSFLRPRIIIATPSAPRMPGIQNFHGAGRT